MPFVQRNFKTGVFDNKRSNRRQDSGQLASPCLTFPQLTLHDFHDGSSSWANVKYASSNRAFMFFCTISWTEDLYNERTQQQLRGLCGLQNQHEGQQVSRSSSRSRCGWKSRQTDTNSDQIRIRPRLCYLCFFLMRELALPESYLVKDAGLGSINSLYKHRTVI